jgi:hypothetical protein
VATFAVLLPTAEIPKPERFLPISPWEKSQSEFVYNYSADDQPAVGWFRFLAPPGAESCVMKLHADEVQAWVDGQPATIANDSLPLHGSAADSRSAKLVTLRVKHKPGYYAGAVFQQPVSYVCGTGEIELGDWCKAGLEYYSGGIVYSKNAELTADQIANQVTLDLGDVRTSAEVTVNGRVVGTRLARPFAFDISKQLKPGKNEIQVCVLNTLANFMSSQPTRYVFKGQTVSGLLGPVSLNFETKVSVQCLPE